jgi:hypothetical protein
MIRRFTICACAALAILTGRPDAMAARQKGGPVETGPGTAAAARKFLAGRWSLVSFEVLPPGQAPLRVNGSGALVYDAFGNLDVEIRVDEATASVLDRAGISSTRGRISISGRTAIDMQARTLTYFFAGHAPLGAPSGPLALNRPRYWQVAGNMLTLTTRGDDGQPLSVARWHKSPAHAP